MGLPRGNLIVRLLSERVPSDAHNFQFITGGRQSKLTNANLSLVSPEPPEQPQATQFTQDRRPARALIGWMRPQQAHALQGGTAGPDAAAQAVAATERARRAVAARQSSVDQEGIIHPAPAELSEHIHALQAHQAAQPMHAQGWKVALVDLTRVCACQPFVVTDQAAARVEA